MARLHFAYSKRTPGILVACWCLVQLSAFSPTVRADDTLSHNGTLNTNSSKRLQNGGALGELIAFRDYQGKSIELSCAQSKEPVLVLVGESQADKKRFSDLLTEIITVLILQKRVGNSFSSFFAKTAQVNNDDRLGDLRIIVLSDARKQIEEGFRSGQILESELRKKSLEQARSIARKTADENFRRNIPPALRRFGPRVPEALLRDAERAGETAAVSVFDSIAPPKKAELAEKETLKYADERFREAAQVLAPHLKSIETQVSFGVLLDSQPFSRALSQNDDKVRLASRVSESYVAAEDRLNVDQAIATNREFHLKTNEASSLREKLLSHDSHSFSVALVGCDGKVLGRWSDSEINGLDIISRYQGLKNFQK